MKEWNIMKGKHVWLTSVLVVAMLSIAAVTSAFAAPKLTVEKTNAPISKSVDISQQSSGAVTVKEFFFHKVFG